MVEYKSVVNASLIRSEGNIAICNGKNPDKPSSNNQFVQGFMLFGANQYMRVENAAFLQLIFKTYLVRKVFN